MIKFVVMCTKAIIALIIAVLFASCNIKIGDGIEGSGNVITEKRTINESFTKIDVNRGIEVIVEQGNTVEIEVEADDNIINHITTKVVNGVLVISTDESIDTAEAEIVRVQMPTINGLESSSGSNINSTNTLKGSTINIKSSSGSEIEVTLEYDAVTSESTSGSEITLAGKALKLETHSSSGSETNARNLLANDVISEGSSGSSTTVNPLVSLNGKASSGSSINYKGTPKTITKEETSGGDVSKN